MNYLPITSIVVCEHVTSKNLDKLEGIIDEYLRIHKGSFTFEFEPGADNGYYFKGVFSNSCELLAFFNRCGSKGLNYPF